MHPDTQRYFRLTTISRLSQSLTTLAGLVEGVAIDREISATERQFLYEWVQHNIADVEQHPFNELIPVVHAALHDGRLTEEARDDIVWLVRQFSGDACYFDEVTTDLQRLHGILGGILADARITEDELRGLQDWLLDHAHLRTCWPYDEIDTLITTVMADQHISADEHRALMEFFTNFVCIADDRVIHSPTCAHTDGTLRGICATDPPIHFPEATFCFTGLSARYRRGDMEQWVRERGGTVSPRVTKHTTYLVVGADGNPCWAYACYGRKIEQAVHLRKAGHRLLIVHEHDFHDAIENTARR